MNVALRFDCQSNPKSGRGLTKPHSLPAHPSTQVKFALALLPALPFFLQAQEPTIRTKVPLVIVPTGVTDRQNHPIPSLDATDFLVLDNGLARSVQVDLSDSDSAPISLVIAIQASGFSEPAIKKLQKTASVISQAVLGANGEAAVLSFDETVTVKQDFTRDQDRVSDAVRQFKPSAKAGSARQIDAIDESMRLLTRRPGPRRSCILLISESRDRGSPPPMDEFAGVRDSVYIPAILMELAYNAGKNTADAFTLATGGRRLGFETRAGLETDLLHIGNDLHSRYLLSLTPDQNGPASFHKLQIRIRNHPDAEVNARPGYWSVASVQ